MIIDKEQEMIIERLFEEMYYQLIAYAQSSLQDYGLAEEAVQDTFKIACAKPNALIESKNSKGWLMRTLQHVVRNMMRSRARLNNLIVLYYAQEEQNIAYTFDEENLDLLYSDLVGNEDYKLLKRLALSKCTMLEAAEEIGISVEACKKRVQRARNRLQKIIKENL